MSQADDIRRYALDHYLVPARARGEDRVTIRTGDVHRDMGLANAMPAVCSAVGGRKFQSLAGVALVEREGPRNGANVYLTFTLAGGLAVPIDRLTEHPASSERPEVSATAKARTEDLDLTGSLVLVSCVKSKLTHPAPARELYTSALFRGVRRLVEARNAPWWILSALHGLVAPTDVVAPYEYTLNNAGKAVRLAWAEEVLQRLLPLVRDHDQVVIFVGAHDGAPVAARYSRDQGGWTDTGGWRAHTMRCERAAHSPGHSSVARDHSACRWSPDSDSGHSGTNAHSVTSAKGPTSAGFSPHLVTDFGGRAKARFRHNASLIRKIWAGVMPFSSATLHSDIPLGSHLDQHPAMASRGVHLKNRKKEPDLRITQVSGK